MSAYKQLKWFREGLRRSRPKMFEATVQYRGERLTFNVSDAGHGHDWAMSRAIAHFFHRLPRLDDGPKQASFRERADFFIGKGLICTLAWKEEEE